MNENTFTTPEGVILTKQENGDWYAVLHDGLLTVNFGAGINPPILDDYDRRTLEALQTEGGLSEVIDTMEKGAKVQIGPNHYAWGGAKETDDGNVIFHLGHLAI